MKFEQLCKELEAAITTSYEEGVALDEAEKMATKFLAGMLAVSERLKNSSLDAKMRKQGAKAVRAALRLEEMKGAERKPTESTLDALVDTNELVQGEETRQYEAEETRDELQRKYDIYKEGHIHFRSIAKGRFE